MLIIHVVNSKLSLMPRRMANAVELGRAERFIIFSRDALRNMTAISRQGANQKLDPTMRGIQRLPMDDAKAGQTGFDHLPVAADPIHRIAAFKNQLIQVLAGKIEMRYSHDFGADQPVPHPKGVPADIDQHDMGQQTLDLGWLDIGAQWPGTPGSLAVPIGQQPFQNRRPAFEAGEFIGSQEAETILFGHRSRVIDSGAKRK
ncbi:MAG TPA: hypothetical protein VND94_10365 [Terriglobia bacterium]|nr:hypothetical protein [Terriglobia bacterium]